MPGYLLEKSASIRSLPAFHVRGFSIWGPLAASSFFFKYPIQSPDSYYFCHYISPRYVNLNKTDGETELSYLQQERKKMLPKLHDLFRMIDSDEDGRIDISEIYNARRAVLVSRGRGDMVWSMFFSERLLIDNFVLFRVRNHRVDVKKRNIVDVDSVFLNA